MSVPFEVGERIMLIDRKARRYLVVLTAGKSFDSHAGSVSHDQIIGRPEGTEVRTASNAAFVAVRPTLRDFILKMPRGAQVVYPKDIGAILMSADVFPGARVLEAGTGSGALTLGLLRAVGPDGCVITYERREEHAARARQNIEEFLGKVPDALVMRSGDITTSEERDIDRVILDLAEPWLVVPAAREALHPGGILCSYVPTVPQVQQITEALRKGGFVDIETTETLVRSWNVEGPSVRPDHRMVAHTGFLTVGRFLGARPASDPSPSEPDRNG